MPVTPEVEEKQEDQELKEASATLKVQGQAELHKSLFQKQNNKNKNYLHFIFFTAYFGIFPWAHSNLKNRKKWPYHYLN